MTYPLIQDQAKTDLIVKKVSEESVEYGLTEASFLDANKVIIGPGLSNSFAVNEFVPKDNLLKAVEIYKDIIERLCR